MSKPKEVYKTIKRSISSTTSNLVSNGNALFQNATSAKPNFNSQKSKWIHPPELLLNNRVEYPARLLGQTEVSSPKGTHVVRDAIHTIKFQMDVNKFTSHFGAKLKKVDIIINVDGIIVQESKTKIVITNQPLHNVSFVADDKQDKRIFSFIAKSDINKHECFVFLSDKLAEQITLTIGEAFDLAYQKFIDKTGKQLEFQKQIILLRKKVAMLEEENKLLKKELSDLRSKHDASNSNNQVKASENLLKQTNVPDNFVSIPPPPGATKHNNQMNPISEVSLFFSNPDVGTRLENLQVDKMEDIFDNDFDPRANEKGQETDIFGLAPFARSNSNQVNNYTSFNTDFSLIEFEDMIQQVDKKIAELHNRFNNGKLETGDTGNLEKEFDNVDPNI